MTNPNVENRPRSIAIAAAQRLKVMIVLTKHDVFLQQTMRSANLVVQQSGMLAADQEKHAAKQRQLEHQDTSPTVH